MNYFKSKTEKKLLPLVEFQNLNDIKDGTEFIHPGLNLICFKIGWVSDNFLFAQKNNGQIHSTQTPNIEVMCFLD